MSGLDREYYERAWSDAGVASWDIGGPQPALFALASTVRGRVLDVGCGSGEHAVLFASRGCEVLGVDFVPHAVERARSLAHSRGVTARFECMNVCDLESLGARFDHAVDCGLLHSLDDATCARFVRALHAVMEPGGRYHALCFSDRVPWSTGPRAFSREALVDVLSGSFAIERVAEARYVTASAPGGVPAWLVSAVRRGEECPAASAETITSCP